MNHGKCENCWWYYQVHGNGFRYEQGRLISTIGSGVCYMHSTCVFSSLTMVKMLANSYCPDYFNRKRQKKTLEQWLDEMNIPRPNIEEFDKLHHS